MNRQRLRYSGRCRDCDVALAAGAEAMYDREARKVTCLECASGEPAADLSVAAGADEVVIGVAGASAQREGDRRHESRDARVRENHPVLGGLVLAMSDDPQSTKSWASGAAGEVALGRRLDGIKRSDVRVLHDRRIPRSRANIDHIVVCPSGVFVIDAKRYVNKRPSLRTEGGLFSPRLSTLRVGSRNETKLVTGVQGQVEVVRGVLEASGLGATPVVGMLCFIDGDWPLFGGDFSVDGVEVLWPGKAEKRIVVDGSLDSAEVERIHRVLARALPVA